MKKLLLLFFGIFLLSSFVSANLNDSLLAYFAFDVNFTDRTGNQTTNFANATIIDDTQKCGDGSVRLNGTIDNFINISDSPSFKLNDSFTINFWINKSPNTGFVYLFSKRSMNVPNDLLNVGYTADQELYVQINDGIGTVIGGALAGTKLENNTWVMWTIIRDRAGQNISSYLDGVIVNYTFDNTSDIGNDDDFLIGKRQDDANPANVTLDEMVFWDRAITNSEIDELYNSGDCFNFFGPVPAVIPPNISTNLSSYATVSWPDLTIEVNVTLGVNWNETPTCGIVDNVSWVTCDSPSTISLGLNSSSYSCTASEINTGDVNFYANCTSPSYNINSTAQVSAITADSNPVIQANLTNLTTVIGQTFNILINGTNISESMNCMIEWGDPAENAECNNATIDDGVDDVITCTEAHAESTAHNTFVNCNGALYKEINSTNYTFVHDNIDPLIVQRSPALDNTSWKIDTQNFEFSLTASHIGPVNISWVNISCSNSTGNTIWGNDTNYDPAVSPVEYTAVSTNFSYEDRINCNITVVDSTGHINFTSSNISVVSLPTTNISGYGDTSNKNVVLSVEPNMGGDAVICGGVSDNSNVICDTDTGTSGLIVSCNPDDGIEQNVSLYVQCNSTIHTEVTGVNLTAVNIFFDTKVPIITVSFPNLNGTTSVNNNTNFTFDITIEDNNTFAVALNCTQNGFPGESGTVDAYSYIEQNINNRSYRLLNTTSVSQTGLIQCIFNASDDHTNNDWIVDNKVTKVKKDLAEGYVGDMNFKIENVKLKADDTPLDIKSVKLKYKKGSYSLDVKIDKKSFNGTVKIPVFIECPDPYVAYRRTTKTKYKEHWVCANGIEGMWIDGNTLDPSDVVFSSWIPEQKGILYLYETENDGIEMESIGGLNYNWSFFNFTVTFAETVSFAAYNNWNRSNINIFQVNITNSSGTKTTYDTTTGNLSVDLANGTYTITQTATNYVFGELSDTYTSGGSATVYNSSFWQAELTVNAKELPANRLLPGTTMETNTTDDGTTNNTASSVTGSEFYKINSGAYSLYINNSPTLFNASFASETGTLTLGEQKVVDLNLTRRYNFVLRREETNELFNMTESNTTDVKITLTIVDEGANETDIPITANQSWINGINYQWDYWILVVEYLDLGESYYRTIIPNYNLSNATAFLIDLNLDTAVQYIIQINDLANLYQNAKIEAKTIINNTDETVIAQLSDLEDKVTFYFDQNQKYTVYATSDLGDRILLGTIIVQEAGTKQVVLPSIPLYEDRDYHFDQVFFNYNVTKATGKISLNYYDTSQNGVDNLTWTLWRVDDGDSGNKTAWMNGVITKTLIYNTTVTSGFNQTLTYPGVLSTDFTYLTEVTLNHSDRIWTRSVIQPIWYASSTTFPGFTSFDEDIKLWMAIGTTLLVLVTFSSLSIEFGMVLSLIILFIFNSKGWLDALGTRPMGTWITVVIVVYGLLTAVTMWKKIQKE